MNQVAGNPESSFLKDEMLYAATSKEIKDILLVEDNFYNICATESLFL